MADRVSTFANFPRDTDTNDLFDSALALIERDATEMAERIAESSVTGDWSGLVRLVETETIRRQRMDAMDARAAA